MKIPFSAVQITFSPSSDDWFNILLCTFAQNWRQVSIHKNITLHKMFIYMSVLDFVAMFKYFKVANW